MRILVVDDNRFIHEVARTMLEPEGHDIDSFISVDEAIEAVHSDDYDLIITDIVMPEKTGVDFMEYLRSRKITIPVLAITAGVENAVADYVHYAGLFADKALSKPLVKEELLDTIEKLTDNVH